MTQMSRWHDEEHELNVVLYPQDNTALRKLQQKLLKFFPFAKSPEGYPFPVMFCRKSIAQVKRELAVWKSISGTCPCRFLARSLIAENNHLLMEFIPATREDAAAINALLTKACPGETGDLLYERRRKD